MDYTKGEWKVIKNKNGGFIIAEQSGKSVDICKMFNPESNDARLISASPDMFEALTEMSKVLYKFIGMIDVKASDGENNLKLVRDAMNKCMKAMTKAEAK